MALLLLGVAVLLLSGLGSVPKVEAQSHEIVVAPTTLTVSEPNGSAPLIIRLTRHPKADVTIGLSTSNNQCSVSQPSVTLTASNWNTGVTVNAIAVDDAIADGTQTCVVQTGLSSSTDPNYNNLDPADVTVTVLDDDTAGIIVSPTTLIVSEPNGLAQFTMRLTSQPIASVMVALSASNGQCAVSPTLIALKPIDWATSVTVTVVAVDDHVAGGTQTCVVQTGPTLSADPNYDGLDPADVTVTWPDDETAARVYLPLVARNWVAGQCDVEPPDTPGQCNGPILSGLTYCGTFPDAAHAIDCFYFDLSTAHTVDLSLTNIPVGHNSDLILRDISLVVVGYSANPGNADEHILTGVLRSGRYYVQVYHHSPGGSTQPYHLRVVYQ